MTVKNPSTFVISITCFDEQNRFDAQAQRKHFRRLVAAGIGAYVGGGGSGEGFVMSDEDYKQLLQVAKEELKGKVPLRFMGHEPRSAEAYIKLCKLAKNYAFDAMQIYSLDMGHGGHPDERTLETYFRDILDEIKEPAVLSSHMAAGYFIPIPVIKRLVHDYKQIIGLNLTNPDLQYTQTLREDIGDRVEMHCGPTWQAMNFLSMGCTGHLSSEGNLVPKTAMSIYHHYKKGDLDKTLEAFNLEMTVMQHCMPAKAALRLLGQPGMTVRKPRLDPTPERVKSIEEWLKKLDIKNIEGIN